MSELINHGGIGRLASDLWEMAVKSELENGHGWGFNTGHDYAMHIENLTDIPYDILRKSIMEAVVRRRISLLVTTIDWHGLKENSYLRSIHSAMQEAEDIAHAYSFANLVTRYLESIQYNANPVRWNDYIAKKKPDLSKYSKEVQHWWKENYGNPSDPS